MKRKSCSMILKTNIIVILILNSLIFSSCGKKEEAPIQPEETNQTEVAEEIEQPEVEEVIEEKMDAHSAYEAFLGLSDGVSIDAVVDDNVYLGYDDFDYENAGKTFSFNELVAQMKVGRLLYSESELKVLYYFMPIEDKELLVLKFESMCIDAPDDDSFSILVLAYENEELHITYGCSSWARSEMTFLADGYIEVFGSAGAGDNIFDAFTITSDGKYNLLYTCETLSGLWWMGSELDFDAYAEIYGEEEDSPSAFADFYYIDGEKYIVFQTANESGELSEKDKEFISRVNEKGIEFSSVEEVDKLIEQKKNENNIPSEIDYSNIIFWNQLVDAAQGRMGIIPMEPNALNWLEHSELSTNVGWRFTPNEYMLSQLVDGEKAVEPTEDELMGTIMPAINKRESSTENPNEKIYFLTSAGTLGSDDYFQIYTTENKYTFITTPDGEYVLIYAFCCDLIYVTLPEAHAADYDGDGEIELCIWVYNLHGTGFMQHTLYMIDKGGEYDSWCAYRLSPNYYVDELASHYYSYFDGENISVLLDGELVDTISTDGDKGPFILAGDMQVNILCGDASKGELDFTLNILPWYYTKINYIGYSGKYAQMNLSYLGDGEWNTNSIVILEEEPKAYNGKGK